MTSTVTPAAKRQLEPPTPIAFELALERLRAVCAARPLAAESVAMDTAPGRVLAADFVASHDQPPFANSAMDGFALRAADVGSAATALHLIGTQLAGGDPAPPVTPGSCVRITTGAPMPAGADTVVVKEVVTEEGENVLIPPSPARGANVRPAGDDMRRGQVVVHADTRLTARHLAVLAAFGAAAIEVRRQPRVAIFSSGDELLAPGAPLQAGRIYDSNGPMLRAQAQAAGAQVVHGGHLPDDPERIIATLTDAASCCDLLVSAGGVSMGEADFLPGIVRARGRVHFWRVRMKPGLPLLFGEIADTPLLGLPGNPVSAAVGFHVMACEALAAMGGYRLPSPLRARLASDLRKRHDRTEFVRCRLDCDADGVLWLRPCAQQGSAQLAGLAAANALARVPEAVRNPAAGSVLDCWPLDAGISA